MYNINGQEKAENITQKGRDQRKRVAEGLIALVLGNQQTHGLPLLEAFLSLPLACAQLHLLPSPPGVTTFGLFLLLYSLYQHSVIFHNTSMRTITPKNAVTIPENAKCVFKGVIHDVYHFELEMFDGTTETFEMLDRPDSVAVLVVDDNKLLVQKQQQPNTKEFFSIPGGRHDDEDQTELEAAKRELLEESGLVCADWKLIEVFQTTKHMDRFVYVFVASNILERREQKPDAGEKIENMWMDYDEVIGLHKRGALDAFGTRALADISDIDDLLSRPAYQG